MSYNQYSSKKRLDNVMSEEKFKQVVDAILEGEYSWACVLILETAGYNPLHYIPYRTYSRLIKKHGRSNQSKYNKSQTEYSIKSNSNLKKECYPSSSEWSCYQ